jgi:hypothetical protein
MLSSYIPQRVKRAKQQITVKLYRDQLATLDSYGRFIDDSRDYIISQALELVFKRDKEFSRWLEQRGSAAGSRSEPMAARNATSPPLSQAEPQAEERGKRPGTERATDARRESA